MMLKVHGKLLLLFVLCILSLKAQRINYLNGIFEDEVCEISKGVNGTCQKISNCMNEYRSYRKKQSVLKICSYDKIALNTLVCCPQKNETEESESFIPVHLDLEHTKSQNIKQLDLLNFESCREEFLPYRKLYINERHFVAALQNKNLPINEENCKILENLQEDSLKYTAQYAKCFQKKIELVSAALYGFPVEKGDRPNMAAIGTAQSNGSVTFICGGSIITNRFIVTAAHCNIKKQVNTVRVGDRYLITKEDDDIAQQLHIQHFISHPNYTSKFKYNDIAMIKTVENIEFNKFVVPSCIDHLNSPIVGYTNKLTVAGYGQTEKEEPSNILLEIGARIIPSSKCNETYQDHDDLPYGIIDSQICVENGVTEENWIQDTCYGDSGSPLQFKTDYEIFPEDFNTTYLSKVYISSTVLGIVSFGIGCGLKAPSVYTKLYYFRDWMKDVIETQ